MAHGTHDYDDDPRNASIRIWVNGELLPRERAVVSVFDSGFVLGDGVWEGLRVRGGHPAFLETHLDRLYEGAQAILMDVGLSRAELTSAIYDTLRANDMVDGVHVRLMVTRGVKATPYQDPRVTVGPATVVIIAEHKEAMPDTVTDGITLFTTHVRRAYPDTLDPKLNSHSKLNDITACIQAYTAGADEALMLDPHGFVATCNSTHFFVVKGTPGGAGGVDLGRPLLPGRHHPRERARAVPHRRHHRPRDDLQPHRRLQRAGGLRDRDVRGRRTGADGGRPHDRHRGARPGRRAPAADVRRPRRRRRRGTVGAVSGETRVAMWSGPRNVSTAMMRSWENREDTVVVDEPFYAAYLLRTGIDHPGRETVIASQPTDPAEVVAALHAPLPDGVTVHYAKQMTHHLAEDMDLSWTRDFRNVLLIRDPAEVVASYVRSRESCEPEDIGLLQQVRLLDALRSGDDAPPVIDAGDFLRDPERHLRWLCDWLGIGVHVRGCWPGRRVRAAATGSGRRTGTTRCGARPGSSRGARAR